MACCLCVANDEVKIIEKFGKFVRIARPGFNVFYCFVGECPAGSLSMRVQQLDVSCETKTKDNVFVNCVVSVQYEVRQEEIYSAFYKLTNPREQITAYVFDVVRSTIPKINLDDVFDSKDDIAEAVKIELSKVMPAYGYNILQALVTDITPNAMVKKAMNEINAAQRQRVAATDKAEAEKILVVKAAEADAESKFLSGQGIARQRVAIVQGLQDSVVNFTKDVGDVTPKDVLQLMLMTQYFDMMKDIGTSSKATTIFVPHSPGNLNDIGQQIRNGLMEGQAAGTG